MNPLPANRAGRHGMAVALTTCDPPWRLLQLLLDHSDRRVGSSLTRVPTPVDPTHRAQPSRHCL